MAGVRMELSGAEETLAYLAGVAERSARPRGLFDNIGAALVVSTQRRFEDGAGPDGSPWPPSLRALAEGGKTLIQSGRLVRSMTHNASDTGVEVGTNTVYAAVHQFGATIRPVAARALRFTIGGREVFAKQVRIPARPFLGLDGEDEKEIEAQAGDWLLGEEAGDAG